jgi:hypothetical protein
LKIVKHITLELKCAATQTGCVWFHCSGLVNLIYNQLFTQLANSDMCTEHVNVACKINQF